MKFVIMGVGLLQIFGGVLAYVAARSAIHEILGTLSFGLGMLSISFAFVLAYLAAIQKACEEAASDAFQSKILQGKIAAAFERIGQS